MRFIIQFLALMALTTSFAWSSINFDSYIGNYLFSKKETFSGELVEKRPGASIIKDTVAVAPLQEVFTRYIFLPSPLQTMPALTIYVSQSTGLIYSFFWDHGGLTTTENFADPMFIENMFKPDVSWVNVEASENKLKFTTYPDDFMGKENVTVTFNKDSVVIKTSGIGSLQAIPFPVTTEERFDLVR